MKRLLLNNYDKDGLVKGEFLLRGGDDHGDIIRTLPQPLIATYNGVSRTQYVGVGVRGEALIAHFYEVEIEIDGVPEVVEWVSCSAIITPFITRELKIGKNVLVSVKYSNRHYTWFTPGINGYSIGLYGQSVKIPLTNSNNGV